MLHELAADLDNWNDAHAVAIVAADTRTGASPCVYGTYATLEAAHDVLARLEHEQANDHLEGRTYRLAPVISDPWG